LTGYSKAVIIDTSQQGADMNRFAKLDMLKLKYREALSGPNRNIDQARRIRDQIIKLEFDLGL
jgi:hypothetical protein